MDNITKLNVLIFSGIKLFNDKIHICIRNQNRSSKPGWEMRVERQIKKW